jgi:thymidylate synthase ThyX
VGVEINSESARYKELVDKYYIPCDWLDLKVNNESLYEAGLAQYKDLTWAEVLMEHSEHGNKLYHECAKQTTEILGRKRAKESSRYFLGYNKQLDYDMQMSFQAFIHFLQLRGNPAAQIEIKAIAYRMLQLVRDIPGNPFEYSLKAFGY